MRVSNEENNPLPQLPQGNKLPQHPAMRRFFKFLSWWLIFTGIYASSSVCPFCGRPGCPVGGVSAGVVGGIFALVMEKGRTFLSYLAGLLALISAKLRRKPKP